MAVRGNKFYEMVFGASNIIGDIKDAIDNAFEEIERIEKHGNKDIKMVEKTALSGFYNKSEIDFIKKHIIPEPGKSGDYEIAYGVFLGYTLGLNSTGLSSAEYKEKVKHWRSPQSSTNISCRDWKLLHAIRSRKSDRIRSYKILCKTEKIKKHLPIIISPEKELSTFHNSAAFIYSGVLSGPFTGLVDKYSEKPEKLIVF